MSWLDTFINRLRGAQSQHVLREGLASGQTQPVSMREITESMQRIMIGIEQVEMHSTLLALNAFAEAERPGAYQASFELLEQAEELQVLVHRLIVLLRRRNLAYLGKDPDAPRFQLVLGGKPESKAQS